MSSGRYCPGRLRADRKSALRVPSYHAHPGHPQMDAHELQRLYLDLTTPHVANAVMRLGIPGQQAPRAWCGGGRTPMSSGEPSPPGTPAASTCSRSHRELARSGTASGPGGLNPRPSTHRPVTPTRCRRWRSPRMGAPWPPPVPTGRTGGAIRRSYPTDPGGAGEGGKQPRQSQGGPGLPDGPGLVSETRPRGVRAFPRADRKRPTPRSARPRETPHTGLDRATTLPRRPGMASTQDRMRLGPR